MALMQRSADLVSMELDDEDKTDMMMPEMPAAPDFPYGLRICLTDAELEKQGLSDECEVGDVLYFCACARVTSVSKNETAAGGKSCRIEMQIEAMCPDPDMHEEEEEE